MKPISAAMQAMMLFGLMEWSQSREGQDILTSDLKKETLAEKVSRENAEKLIIAKAEEKRLRKRLKRCKEYK